MKLRKLTLKDVQVSFTALGEFNSFDAPENFEFEQDHINHIKEELQKGNPFAWFTAKVTVRWGDYFENEYLGCCSYKSEQDFKENSGYYNDMIERALEGLNTTLSEEFEKFKTLIEE